MHNPDPACPGCGRALPSHPNDLANIAACPNCRAELLVTVLPSFGRGPVTGVSAERTTSDDDATCFFHPTKKAAVPCDRCGRFLCALCDLPVAGEHLCPTCVQSSQKKDSLTGFGKPRVRWDVIVWWTVLAPIIICYIATPVSGFVAAGLAVWGLRSPPSRVVNSRARLIAGLVAGVLLSVATIALLFSMRP
jgi:hypothetical protein